MAGAAALALYPASFPRVQDIADAYDLYRVVELQYRLHPCTRANTATGFGSAAFYPGITDNAPANGADLSENRFVTVLGGTATTPSSWVSVPRKDLQGMHTWYKTVAGTPETAEEQQGTMYIRGGVNPDGYVLEMKGVFELTGPSNTSSTPAVRSALARQSEKQRILRLLAEPDLSPTVKALIGK